MFCVLNGKSGLQRNVFYPIYYFFVLKRNCWDLLSFSEAKVYESVNSEECESMKV